MKRNALTILGVFTILLYGCGTQTLRTSTADDGLYFDPKVEQMLNLSKAKEREANAAALKAETELALRNSEAASFSTIETSPKERSQ